MLNRSIGKGKDKLGDVASLGRAVEGSIPASFKVKQSSSMPLTRCVQRRLLVVVSDDHVARRNLRWRIACEASAVGPVHDLRAHLRSLQVPVCCSVGHQPESSLADCLSDDGT